MKHTYNGFWALLIILAGFGYSFQAISLETNSDNESITIGNQIWTSKNLEVTTFRNGDEILFADTEEEWYDAQKNQTPAYCLVKVDGVVKKEFGYHYNNYAVTDKRGLAPVGWRVPNSTDFLVLFSAVDPHYKSLDVFDNSVENIAGESLKKIDSKYWNLYPEVRETNSSGFTGLPAGYRSYAGLYGDAYDVAHFWCADGRDKWNPYVAQLSDSKKAWVSTNGHKNDGLSVRLIKE